MEVIGFKQVQDLILSCLNLDLFDSEFWKIHKTNKQTIINIWPHLCPVLKKK